MSKFEELGFTGALRPSSATPEVDGYVCTKGGHPYHIHPTATPDEWAALQEVIGTVQIAEFVPVVTPKITYAQHRSAAYPSIEDQLDTLYHGGYDAWKATITAVKEKYPKG